jgi:hypothetical protein
MAKTNRAGAQVVIADALDCRDLDKRLARIYALVLAQARTGGKGGDDGLATLAAVPPDDAEQDVTGHEQSTPGRLGLATPDQSATCEVFNDQSTLK